jgi:hypothetical protein
MWHVLTVEANQIMKLKVLAVFVVHMCHVATLLGNDLTLEVTSYSFSLALICCTELITCCLVTVVMNALKGMLNLKPFHPG